MIDEDEDETGRIPVSGWSWIAFVGSLVNFIRTIFSGAACHLEDVTVMLATEYQRRKDRADFRESVHADLERLPAVKE